MILNTEVQARGCNLRVTKPKEFRETSNAIRPHRRLRSRIGFLGLGESSRRCRPVRRPTDHVGHRDRVIGAVRDGSNREIGKWPGFAQPFPISGRWPSQRGPDLSTQGHETLTATSAKDGHTPTPTNFFVAWIVRREAVDEMDNLFFTTLRISVVMAFSSSIT